MSFNFCLRRSLIARLANTVVAITLLFGTVGLPSQMTAPSAPIPLDPAHNAHLSLTSHTPLPEEYIWTAGDITAKHRDHNKFPWSSIDRRTAPHYFRGHFHLAKIPISGTIYIAGPRSARVYLNGTLLGDFSTNTDQPINFRVFHADATKALRTGDNVVCIEAVRGKGVVTTGSPITTQQLAYGEVLAVKLVAAPFGQADAPALLISNKDWRSKSTLTPSWQQPSFDDSNWPHVESLGPIESNIDFFQWSVDAGMYGWPGYQGMSPWLRTLTLSPAEITHVYPGAGSFDHIADLTQHGTAASSPFTITFHQPDPSDAEAPTFLLDFGREIAGRIVFQSESSTDTLVSIAYGESELEALATGISTTQRGGNYLGTNLLTIPPHGVARGPKSAFRYVRIRFLRGAPITSFRSIHAEAIVYPVEYAGSFESSDPVLNRIWETSAYTAHLCMQDDIWDAPKRDRGRWAGDLDVEAPTILTAFGDTKLLEDTLTHIAEITGPNQPVSGITGYTAQWVTTLATLYQDSGDRAFVESQHDALLRLLQTMDNDLDPTTSLLKKDAKGWGFVDWSPGLYGATADTAIGTTLEFLRAYQAAPALLRADNDESNAKLYEQKAARLQQAAREALLSPTTQTVGQTWQLNTLSVLTNLNPAANPAIWTKVFSTVKQDAPTDQVISPYFNAYLIKAMSQTGHSREALRWLRDYWGGMLAEGATSFWESYDLRWPKSNYHLSLEADGTSGYFVSLAHGWSSGPLPWISENILGIRPTAPGYAAVELRPNLLGLAYARGSVATPHGPIRLSLDSKTLSIDLPEGVESAELYLPTATGANSTEAKRLTHSGHYDFSIR